MGGIDPLKLQSAERVVQHAFHGFGGVALIPVRFADPVAELALFSAIVRMKDDCTYERAVCEQSYSEGDQSPSSNFSLG